MPINPGEAYVLEYAPRDDGDTLTVRAESEVWTNSKGIAGFDATLLEPNGSKDAGDPYIVQTHLWDVVETLAQCDVCDDHYPESEMHFESVPGATLAWCPECTEPSKAEMYGARP